MSSSSFICETCKKSFSKRCNLNVHIKTAKYCIKMRDDLTITDSFTCDICTKNFSSKQNYQQHYGLCAMQPGYIKLKELCIQQQAKIEEKDNLIEVLRRDLQILSLEAVKRPTTVNNTNNNSNTTNINNLAVFVKSEIKSAIQSNPINKNIMDKGIPGVAEHVGEVMKSQFIPPMYMIADASRLKCKYKDEDGNIVTDHKCSAIVSSISPELSDQATTIHKKVASSYEIRLNIANIENIKIPTSRKLIRQVEQQIDDLPDRRMKNHPDRPRLQQLLEDYNDDFRDLIMQLETLKEEAELNNVRLDVPLEYYEEDLDKTSQNLKDIKNITGENKAVFAKTLIEIIA
jgi:hypothetical protein